MSNKNPNSVDTILQYENRNMSQLSEVWSTAHIPDMDNASGGNAQGKLGRHRLRLGALALGSLMSMHCRVAASALTGGSFIFILFLVLMTVLLANPMRHFEVYLGQWSISGPGRAFRFVPLLDGLGIAMCINALVRAIVCCTIAAISAIYILHAVSDVRLPYTYCRDFELKPYDPVLKDISRVKLRESRFSLLSGNEDDTEVQYYNQKVNDVIRRILNNDSDGRFLNNYIPEKSASLYKLPVCKEKYDKRYPTLYSTPAYNFFYVEVVSYRSNYNFGQFNITLLTNIIVVWAIVWVLLVVERLVHGRLVWNNMYSWLVAVPWAWAIVLVTAALVNMTSIPKSMRSVFRIGVKEVLSGLADAFEVTLYIHSASMGTELVHGKGLNHYASGHIDTLLNGENVWHSGLLMVMCGLHTGGAALCALVDCVQPDTHTVHNMYESTLWIIPMYSKCTQINNYSHFMSVCVFGGLMFSYLTVGFVMVKTALHTVFEYKVKLVFAEQVVVAAVILSCMGLSVLFATTGGIALLESVDAVMTGLAVPMVCLLELIALLYVYRGRDFISDMNLATEENVCSTRIGTQWQIIPVLTLITLGLKASVLANAEMPSEFMWMAGAPLVGVALCVPLRAVRNVIFFIRSRGRRTAPRRT